MPSLPRTPRRSASRSATGLASGLALAVLVALAPTTLRAQTLGDLVAGIQAGGGWVSIDIENGRGEIRTRPIPTGGLRVSGCMRVWPGHSGRWEIDARDLRGEGSLSFRGGPGTAQPIVYRTGMTAELELDVRWSEPRDTTLLLWVGFDRPGATRDACEPVYGSGH